MHLGPTPSTWCSCHLTIMSCFYAEIWVHSSFSKLSILANFVGVWIMWRNYIVGILKFFSSKEVLELSIIELETPQAFHIVLTYIGVFKEHMFLCLCMVTTMPTLIILHHIFICRLLRLLPIAEPFDNSLHKKCFRSGGAFEFQILCLMLLFPEIGVNEHWANIQILPSIPFLVM